MGRDGDRRICTLGVVRVEQHQSRGFVQVRIDHHQTDVTLGNFLFPILDAGGNPLPLRVGHMDNLPRTPDQDIGFRLEQIFDISEREWEPNVQDNCQADDFPARLEVRKGERLIIARGCEAAMNRSRQVPLTEPYQRFKAFRL